jgi:2-methylisocitrate lyase-like PEP mutase family enzyme
MLSNDLVRDAESLRELHRAGNPLVLPNVWDAASARAVADAGYPAIATSSAAIARALGYEDHEDMPADEAFGAVARITRVLDVPVTADIESGYGLPAPEVVDRLLDAGAVGCNLEDTDHSTGGLRDPGDNAERLAAVRAAASERGVPIVINARVDVFVRDPDRPDALDDGIARGKRYIEAGADCTYPIGLADPDAIQRYLTDTGAAVNVMLRPGSPSITGFTSLGVHRISVGSSLFRVMQRELRQALEELHERGVLP